MRTAAKIEEGEVVVLIPYRRSSVNPDLYEPTGEVIEAIEAPPLTTHTFPCD